MRFALPRKFPKNFSSIEKKLSEIMDNIQHVSKTKEIPNGQNPEFVKMWESLYFESLGKEGEERSIRMVSLLMLWSMMMVLFRK